MLNRSRLVEIVQPVVSELGLKIFDIDLPSAQSGVLRIFICSPDQFKKDVETPGVVNLEDCARVSSKLSMLEGFEALIPEGTTLEVSSPGVNRRLKRVEHFEEAVGEHVKVKYCGAGNAVLALKGIVQNFDGSSLGVKEDKSGELRIIPFADIVSARVDFLFQ